jgi:hypothetical protein
MDGIPPILSSAQSALDSGFSRLNAAAAEVASSAATTGNSTPTSNIPGDDPIVDGMVDTFEARGEVQAGVALLHAFRSMTDDLMEMSDPYPRYQHIDLYA